MSDDEDDSSDELDWTSLKTIRKFDLVQFDGPGNSKFNLQDFHKNNKLLFGDGIYNAINPKATTPVSLLVESLVQQLCTMLEPNQTKSRLLYINICEHLHQLKLIDETYAMGEFEMMRSQYQRALYQLVSISRGEGLPVELDTMWPLASPCGLEWSRYHREFEEIGFIAGGGFGKVYKARNKLDGITYAIKKITLKSTSVNNVLTHVAEVKTLASLNHQNIVPYKAAWLEPLLVPQNAIKDKENEEESESDSDDVETPFNTESEDIYATGNKKDSSDSDFIVFQSSEQLAENDPENNILLKFENHKISIAESQPHVKLKWATLFIQMTLCQLTLKEFLEQRNSCDDFAAFYSKFIIENRKYAKIEEKSPSANGIHVSSSFEFDEFDSTIMSDHPSHLEVVTNIFTQLLCGLSYIHSRKIVHHDVKPSNIFVSVEAEGHINVQLGDFGLACPLQEPHTGIGFGTPLYAAPEQLEGVCDFKSDIYSLGIILLELLVPLKTDMERANTIRDVRKGKVPEDISVNYKSLLKRLIDHRPKKRPDTSQLIEIMNKLSSNKDQIIDDLQRRLSEQDTQIQSLKLLVEEQRKNRDFDVRGKDNEIEQLKAKIHEMEKHQN